MSKVQLFLGKVPRSKLAQLELCRKLAKQITGREPTPEETARAREILGLPPVE